MGFTVDTLIEELRSHLGLDEDELDEPAALLLLNRSYWEILNRFPLREKEKVATFDTVDGTASYELPVEFDALTLISIEDLNDAKHIPLNRLTSFRYESLYQNATDAEAKPTDYLRENNCVKLWPTPDDTYTITLRYWANLDDLDSGSSEPDVPREWHEVILYGAIYRGFIKLKDFAQANAINTVKASMMNNLVMVEGVEEGDSHLSGLDVKMDDNYT